MKSNTINLSDVKKMRLERHWSQDQLAEMSGLNIRTIQRIENGKNAGLESLKSLASVFEINIEDSQTNKEMEQIRLEEKYIQKVKGFYILTAIANLSLMVLFIILVNNGNDWDVFFWLLFSWTVILGIYSFYFFDFFGEKWKRKLINKKFKKK